MTWKSLAKVLKPINQKQKEKNIMKTKKDIGFESKEMSKY